MLDLIAIYVDYVQKMPAIWDTWLQYAKYHISRIGNRIIHTIIHIWKIYSKVTMIFSGAVDPWTGAVFNNVSWRWLDNTALSTSSPLWHPAILLLFAKQPDGHSSSPDLYNEGTCRCTKMDTSSSSGRLYDEYCMEQRNYLCEIKQ